MLLLVFHNNATEELQGKVSRKIRACAQCKSILLAAYVQAEMHTVAQGQLFTTTAARSRLHLGRTGSDSLWARLSLLLSRLALPDFDALRVLEDTA